MAGKTDKRTRERSERASAHALVKESSANSRNNGSTEAVKRNVQTREYFSKVASNKKASFAFLKAAGILDSKGTLAKPFRD